MATLYIVTVSLQRNDNRIVDHREGSLSVRSFLKITIKQGGPKNHNPRYLIMSYRERRKRKELFSQEL